MRRDAPPASCAAALLQLIWLASPALPVGGFSYSEGLEAAVEAGVVHDEASAGDWLQDQLALGLGRCELPLLADALGAWRDGDTARVRALNDWLLATRESAELRLQSEQMGRSLADWLKLRPDVSPAAREALATLPPTYPVAFALALAAAPVTPQEALLAFGFGWAENAVQAAVRAVPLGQSAGQRILGALAEALPSAVDLALTLGEDERLAALPGLGILSARHEDQYSRLFRS